MIGRVNAPVRTLPGASVTLSWSLTPGVTSPGAPRLVVLPTTPRLSAFSPPVSVMFPLPVAVVVAMSVTACVVTVGATVTYRPSHVMPVGTVAGLA